MNDISDRRDEFFKDTDDLVESLNAIDHPCRLCPMTDFQRAALEILPRLKMEASSTAQDESRNLSELFSHLIESTLPENARPISQDEIRKRVGSMFSENLEMYDEDIEIIKNELVDITNQCEGIVSLMSERNRRRIGVIVCGSSALADGDNMLESSFVTRYTSS